MAVAIDKCDRGPYTAGREVTLTGTCGEFNLVTFTMNGDPVEHSTEPGDDGTTWTCTIIMPPCPSGSDSNQEIDFSVTDTFHVTVINGGINSVTTSSNDPPLFHEARDWVRQNRPQLLEEPCRGIWEGGPTPGDCVRAMVKGYAEFIALKKNN